MKRLLIVLAVLLPLTCSVAWAQDDIEVTDSTSTDWGGGGGGGLNPQTPTGPVTSMTLSQTSLSLTGGQTVQLVATVNADAANKNISWTSANSAIATVDAKGNVFGIAKGVTTVTATSVANNSIKQTCTVTVTSDYEGVKTGFIFPWGHDEPWTMTYQQIAYSEDDPSDIQWTLLDFDDSSWPTMYGPMGRAEGSRFDWQGEHNGFYLRREFFQLSPSCKTYTFYTIHDDDLWVYLNGELIHHFEGWSERNVRQISIPSDKLRRGRNILALKIIQGTGDAELDYALYTKQMGDVNGDGIINTVDASYILMYLVDKTPADFIESVADVDGSGTINTVDATAILKKLVE